MNKYFVDSNQITDDSIIIQDAEDIKHIVKVLRLGAGAVLTISDNADFDYKVEIKNIMSTEIECKILDKQKFSKEPNIKITLFQGIPKQSKMEFIVQKNVELGVVEFVPVFMDRTIVMDKGNFDKKISRWNKISQESSGQCKRGIVPEVKPAIKFDELLVRLETFDLKVFPYENQEEFTIKQLLREFNMQQIDGEIKVAVIIGPEGGFSNSEALSLEEMGIKPVTLGKTVLRTETAGMATVSMIMYEMEL